jgi:hypothetical protein
LFFAAARRGRSSGRKERYHTKYCAVDTRLKATSAAVCRSRQSGRSAA